MGAGAAVKADLGDDGLDRRQFDPLIDSLQLLIALGQNRRAGRTDLGPGFDDVVGMQFSSRAGAAALPRLRRSGLLALCPCEGGREELSGVLGGSFNFTSNSATRAVRTSTFAISSPLTANAASNCVRSAMISASLCAPESWPGSGSGGA
jgi:hypothetical protein